MRDAVSFFVASRTGSVLLVHHRKEMALVRVCEGDWRARARILCCCVFSAFVRRSESFLHVVSVWLRAQGSRAIGVHTQLTGYFSMRVRPRQLPSPTPRLKRLLSFSPPPSPERLSLPVSHFFLWTVSLPPAMPSTCSDNPVTACFLLGRRIPCASVVPCVRTWTRSSSTTTPLW